MSTGRQLLAASSRKVRDRERDDDVDVLEASRSKRELVPGKGRASAQSRIDRKAEVDEVGDDAISSARELVHASTGLQLPSELSKKFATELGVDVTRVRIHTDATAAKAAATLNANAFTIGNDIYFGDGQYDPSSERGVHLIAHEMVHVADNQRGAVTTSEAVSRPDDPHERRADEVADRFTAKSGRVETSNTTALADHLRREARRRGLPNIDELEKQVGRSFDFVETFSADTTELARGLMAAGAFAVSKVVALADPSPERETLLQELTQVATSGGRLAAARADGTRRMETMSSVDSRTIHRDQAKKPAASDDKADTPEDIKKRVEKFKASVDIPDKVKKEDLKFVGNVQNDKGVDERYYKTSEPFAASEYAGASTKNKATDLSALLKTDDGKKLRLHNIEGSSKYIFTKQGTQYSEKVKKVKVISTWPDYFKNIGKIEASSGKKIDFTWPDPDPKEKPTGKEHAYEKDEPAVTAEENKDYRGAMRYAIAKKFADGKFDALYEHVVAPQYFSQRICGDIFEECVVLAANKDEDLDASTDQPIFEKSKFKGIGNKKKVMGDGTLDMEVKNGKDIHAIIEAKAYDESGPSGSVKAQMKVYAGLLGQTGYTIKGVVQKIAFNHVAYFVTTSGDPKKKEKLLGKWHDALVEAGFKAGQFSLNPPPKGKKYKIKLNPEFEFDVAEGQKSFHLFNPPMGHPGFRFDEVSATLGDDSNIKSGTVIYSVEAADLKKSRVSKPITPGSDASIDGQVDNKLTGLTSKLSNYLPVEVDAAIVDKGVEATLKLKKGAAKGLAGFEIDAVELKALYSGTLAVEGTVGVKHKNGKIGGSVTIGYDNGWSFVGTIDVGAGVIPGFPAFKASISKSATGEWKVTVDQDVTFEKKVGGINLTGTASDISYNFTTGKFGGEAELDADLGPFGKASGSAKLKDNQLTNASLSYDTPEFTYPAKSEKPAFKGKVGGTIKYDEGKFSGSIRGTANLNIPALKAVAGEEGAGLAVNAHINSDGTYSGTVETTSPLKFGKHIEVPSISCTLDKDGSLSGSFDIKVVKLKYLENAHVKCKVTKAGIEIEEADIAVKFGNEEKGKFWGTLKAGYKKETGLEIGGEVNYKIKEGMIATGTLKYSTQTHAVSLEMKVSEITLMDKTISKTLFKASKQIPVVNVYGLGVYIDIGFDLGFDFGFKLGLKPTVSFDGLSLETWDFKKIEAKLELLGLIFAQLTGTPKLGIGVFALDPSILRGGGGLKVPIVGRAEIKPTGTIGLSYTPSGGVEGEAKIGMAASFGITGSVKPYAEFAVLNDLWNPKWEGEALASFEILKPKELFNFQVDLAGDMTKQEAPPLPEENAAKDASKPQGTRTFEAPKGESKEAGAEPPKNASTPKDVKEGGDEGPFSLNALMDKLKAIPGFATAEKIFKIAKKVWDVVKPIYDLVEPLFDLIGKRINEFIDLFDTELPKSAEDAIPWVWKLAKKVIGFAVGGLPELASAIRKMLGKAAAFAKKLINKAVKEGWIGVKRHSYYIWKPWPMDNYEFMAAAEYKINIPDVANIGHGGPDSILLSPSSAVAIVLYEALDAVGVGYTYVGNSDINRPYNDFWTGDGARG